MIKAGIKTVGELKEVLEKLDPSMGIDLLLTFYRGRNFCVVKKNFYLERLKPGVSVVASTNDEDNTLVISNSSEEDFFLDENL